MDLAWMFIVSLAASAFSAAVGLGGGLLLLGVMPLFIPISAVVPIQAVVNLSSNLSRTVFGRHKVVWRWLPATIAGGLSGTLIGWPWLGKLPVEMLQTLLAVFILLSVWTALLSWLGRILKYQYWVTLVQSFLALFVGSVATLSLPVVLARGLSLAAAISTNAMQMAVLNIFRLGAFYALGFQFALYGRVILAFIAGAILGALIGERCQTYISERWGRAVLKVLLTVLALWMLF